MCYHFSSQKETRAEAHNQCTALSAELAIFQDFDEIEQLNTLIAGDFLNNKKIALDACWPNNYTDEKVFERENGKVQSLSRKAC